MTSCSVIIAGYSAGPTVFAAIKSALCQDNLVEVILVDQGNSPDIVARLQQMALAEPRLRILTGSGDIGLAKAYNLGAKQVSSEFYAFLRPDCLLSPEALTACITALAGIPSAMLAGCAVMNPDGSLQAPNNEKSAETTSGMREVESLSQAFLVIKAGDFKFFGGFDEGFIYYDVVKDFCKSARTAGKKLLYLPAVTVTHIHVLTRDALAPKEAWCRTKDAMRYCAKHKRGRYFPGDMLFMRIGLLLRHVLIGLFTKKESAEGDPHRSLPYRRLIILASGLATLQETKQFYGKTVFVTGATSELGLCVVRRLMAAGASVLALSRGDPIPFEHTQLRWIQDDFANPEIGLQGYYADMAVHCAPLSFLPLIMPVLKEAGVTQIVAFSSSLVSAKLLTNDAQEKEFLENLGKAEKTVEETAKEIGISSTILRYCMSYGVGLDQGITLVYRLIRRFGCVAIYPPALGRCHPVHVDDLGLAAVQALDKPVTFGKNYNLSGGEILTYREMLERMFALCGKRVRMFDWSLLPYFLDLAGRVLRNRRINRELAFRMNEHVLFFHDAAKQDFGFQPRAFLSGGIRDMEGI